MITVGINDTATLAAMRKHLGALSYKAPSILQNAINATAREARKSLASGAAGTYTRKKSEFTKAMDLTRASKSHMDAIIRAKGEAEELQRFKTKESGGVVKAQIMKASTMKALVRDNAAAFKVRFDSGHETIVQRRPGERYSLSKYVAARANPKHYKTWHGPSDPARIKKLLGPSIPVMIGGDKVNNEDFRQRTLEMLAAQIEKRIAKEVQKGAVQA